MNMVRSVLLVCAILWGAAQAAMAANPIITTAYSADPSAHVFGNRLYVYPSHNRDDAQEFGMTDYHVYSTEDMTNWQDHGVVLSLSQIPWAKAHLWAPDCGYKDGTYYLYFPADADGHYHFKIGGATSQSTAGPFVAEAQPIPGVDGIDPSIFIDDDGTPYLIWAAGGPMLCHLRPDMKTLAGTPTRLTGCAKFFEGPWLFKRSGLYHLTYPAFLKGGSNDGGNGQNYDYAVATSIFGPYTYRGTFTRTRADQPAAGNIHGSQVQWHGHWYCFYHDCSLSQGDPKSGFKRSVRVDEIHFGPNGIILPLKWTDSGPAPLKNLDPYARCQAVTLAQTAGPGRPESVATEACAEGGEDLGSIRDGSWAEYANADFGSGAQKFIARIASPLEGGKIEIHRDSRTTPPVGVCPVPKTGGWQTWQTVSCALTNTAGVHEIFLVFRGRETGGLFNLQWFEFTKREAKNGSAPNRPFNSARGSISAERLHDAEQKPYIFPQISPIPGAARDHEPHSGPTNRVWPNSQ